MGLPSIQLIAKERVNQISDGHDAAHDDDCNQDGELLCSAIGLSFSALGVGMEFDSSKYDPWNLIDKFGDDRVRALTVAGALISAELDRVLRIEVKGSKKESKGMKKSKKKSKKTT